METSKRKAARAGGNSNKTNADNPSTQSRAAQCARLLAYLQQVGTLTTLQARDRLNVMHPAGRVFELREMGHNIVTTWTWDRDHEGRRHRVGRYALLAGGGK